MAGDRLILGFFVPGKPVAKARHRTGRGRIYTPTSTAEYERTVGWEAIAAVTRQRPGLILPIAAPIGVRILVKLTRPKRPKWKDWPAVKPDLDNYVKAILDGLQPAIFKDDALVVQLEACKRYVVAEERQGVKVEIRVSEAWA